MKQANRVVALLKVTLKTVLWLVISSVLLFILIAVLIQFPAIQTKIIHYVSTSVSNKTHSRADIKNISILFPKSIIINGLYLEDLEHDTLIYAGNLSVNIAFSDLFKNRLHITSFNLEKAVLNLRRTEKDSLFNYNFLISAFSDTLHPKKTEPDKKSRWVFSADILHLKSIKLLFNDEYTGTKISAVLKDLKLKMNQIDLVNSIFKIDELVIDDLNSNVLITRNINAKENTKVIVSPIILVNKFHINNTNISYADSNSRQSGIAFINQLQVNEGSIDLQQQILTLDKIALIKSDLHYIQNASLVLDLRVMLKTIPVMLFGTGAK